MCTAFAEKLKNEEPWGAKKIALPSFSTESLLAPEDSPQAPQLRRATGEIVTVDVTADAVRRITGDVTRGPAQLPDLLLLYGAGE
jgi:hypothetical protein